jgi:hypothetical protein
MGRSWIRDDGQASHLPPAAPDMLTCMIGIDHVPIGEAHGSADTTP